MSAPRASLTYHTPGGVTVARIGGSPAANAAGDWLSLTYTNTVNAVGWVEVQTRRGAVPERWLVPDAQIALYRGGKLEGETRWVARLFDEDETADTITIGAEAAIGLLDTRAVIGAAGDATTSKTGPADDVMKAIVREQLGSSAGDARGLGTATPGYPFSVAGDTSQGPTVTRGFAYQPLLQTLQEFAQQAAAAGTFIAFDIIWNGVAYEFRTYTGRRGAQRGPGSTRPLIFPATDLSELRITRDYRTERTVAYVAGQGLGPDRDLVSAEDAAQVGRSSIGRRETVVEDTRIAYGDTTALSERAAQEVRAQRARRVVAATITDTGAYQYGTHWDFGDEIGVQLRSGEVVTARIDSRTVRSGPDGERVSAQLRMEE